MNLYDDACLEDNFSFRNQDYVSIIHMMMNNQWEFYLKICFLYCTEELPQEKYFILQIRAD